MGVTVDVRAPGNQPDEAAAVALEKLRTGGQRITGARSAVIKTLAEIGGHPSAEQLCDRIHEQHSTIHRATIYRTLETLAELGIVTHVHIGGGATAYHLASEASGHEHLHAKCRVCGRIIDLPGDLLDPVTRRLAEDGEFELDPPHVALSGTCRECHEAGK